MTTVAANRQDDEEVKATPKDWFNILRQLAEDSDSSNATRYEDARSHDTEGEGEKELKTRIQSEESLEYEHMEDGRVPLLDPSDSDSSVGPAAAGRSGLTQSESFTNHLIPTSTVKSIGWLGSFAVAVNALASPAILQLPSTYQQSGFIPTTVTLILVGILSSFCSLHMAQVVSRVPRNHNFDLMVEYSEPFRVFWGKKAFVLTQIVFFLCSVCLNSAGIVDVAQVVDTFLGHSVGSVGIRFHPIPVEKVDWQHGPCTRDLVKEGMCDPFGDDDRYYGNLLLTAGYFVAAAVLIPVCLMDLKENVSWQIFGFCVLCINSVQFVGSFIWYGINTEYLPMWGDGFDHMIGVILFNFSLVVAIPSWLHEKRPEISVHKVVYGASFLATILYISVGSFGALSIPHVNSNVLEPMVSGAFGPLMRISASFFAFVNIGLDIPLFSVLARYNLVNSGLCSRRFANILVVYIPWMVSWMFYQGDAIEQLLAWGGVLFTSMAAFILPLCLALYLAAVTNEDVVTHEHSSIAVYGTLITSRWAQIVTVSCLLLVGCSAVAFALFGLL